VNYISALGMRFRNSTRQLTFVALAIWMLFAQNSAFGAEIRDRVVAFVDAQAITLSELEMKFTESRKVKADIIKEEVLNTMINRVLLLREAKKIRLEAPSEEELLKEYIDMKIRALIRVKEEEIHDFYGKHIDNFEGKELEDVRDNIENYLIEYDLNERLKSHINELKEKTCVRIQLNPE
jgi:ribosomal protein S13